VKLRIEPMTPEDFVDMAAWHYEPPYDFYDSDVEPVVNPERFFAVRDEAGAFVGHYYFEPKGEALEYGIGLRPELTGRGAGLEVFRAGLEFARANFSPTRITLAVAAFNERAITVYARAGFRETGRHTRTFDRFGDVEYIDMVLAE
jgi:ribosomal-protein-alanine N-acetyltransferase